MISLGDDIFRSARPKSEADLAGVQTVINLESGFFERFHNDWYEDYRFRDTSRAHITIPCSDFMPPKPHQVERFLVLCRAAKRPVLFHCFSGVDRTGWMAMMKRIYIDDWSTEKALAEWAELGRHARFFWWRYFL